MHEECLPFVLFDYLPLVLGLRLAFLEKARSAKGGMCCDPSDEIRLDIPIDA